MDLTKLRDLVCAGGRSDHRDITRMAMRLLEDGIDHVRNRFGTSGVQPALRREENKESIKDAKQTDIVAKIAKVKTGGEAGI